MATKPKPTLHTIGHEGLGAAEFLAALRGNGIELLVDVRELLLSHKKGFSTSALQANLRRKNPLPTCASARLSTAGSDALSRTLSLSARLEELRASSQKISQRAGRGADGTRCDRGRGI